MTEFIPVNQPSIDELEKKYLLEAIDTGWISSDGPFVAEFENRFATQMNRKFGVAVSNGTVALEIAFDALNLKPGDEVIVPTFTIISCLNAIIKSGAIPVFVDSYPDTWNMNVEKIEEKISHKTKAILVVHIYGLPTELNKVLELAEKYEIKIVEDAAEAHGQTYYGRPCGSFGLISTFSFYANKHVTMGEGGIVLTNDEAIAEKVKLIRNLYFKPERRFVHDELGGNYRITNLQAAVGLAQLEKLEMTIKRKKHLGELYNQYLSDIEALQLPLSKKDGYENHYWVYGVVLKNDKSAIEIIDGLAKKGIGTRPFFWPLHLQPVLKKFELDKIQSLPVSENLAKFGFYLPSGVGTTDDQIKRSALALKQLL
jgi:perosamine synthetase